MSSLNKDIVLVLNKHWQAINICTPADGLSMMYANTATGLDIRGKDDMVPLTWKEWVGLSCSDDDHFVKTIQGNVKIPKIIILCRYDKVPKKRPKITRRGIWRKHDLHYAPVRLRGLQLHLPPQPSWSSKEDIKAENAGH